MPTDAPITTKPTKRGDTNPPTVRPTHPWPTSQPTRLPSAQPSRQPSRQPSSQPAFQPTGSPSRQPTAHPSSNPSSPSRQPSSQPSNPSSQPSMLPSSQPSSSPSDSARMHRNVWNIKITRFDDFFDPATISNLHSFDFDKFCTNENWRTSGSTSDCTLRLAIYYCLFRMPFDNPFSCQIWVPPESVLQYNTPFNIRETRYQRLHTSRILLNFRASTFVVIDSFKFDFGTNSNVYLLVTNIVFGGSSGSFVSLGNIDHIHLDSVMFDGVSLSIGNANRVKISETHMRDIQSSYALSLYGIKTASILNSSFYNNAAGALIVVGCKELTIDTSRFIKNTALFGSAVYLHNVTSATLINNQFFYNIANHAGALYWIFGFMPAPNITWNNVWRNNTARYYGNDTSSSFCGNKCLLVSPSLIQVTDYTNISLPSIISLSVVDYYGTVIKSYNDNVKIYANKGKSHCHNYLGESVLKRDAFVVDKANSKTFMTVPLQAGECNISNVGVRCLPSGNMTIRLDLSLIVPYDVGRFYWRPFFHDLPVVFRKCGRGEIFDLYTTTQSSCSKCIDGYSMNENTDFKSVVTKCTLCPPLAHICYGDQILVKLGTWRSQSDRLNIYNCQSKHACLAGNMTGQAACNIGHIGPICGFCKIDYFLSTKKQCIKCDQRLIPNVLSGIVIFLILLIFAFLFYKFSNIIFKYYDLFTAIFISNIVSTFQIITLGAGSNLSFEELKSSSSAANSLRILNFDFTTVFSLACYFDYNYYDLLKFNTPFPLVIVFPLYIISFFFKSHDTRRNILSVIVSVLYFVLPSVSALIFKIFKCIDVESKSYLSADLTIECSGHLYDFYIKWAYASILLYPIGIPIVFISSLYTRRHIIANRAIIEKCQNAMTHPSLNNLYLSPQYELLKPLSSIYLPYRYKYFWYDVYDILIRLLLTSIIPNFFDDQKVVIVVSILVSLFSYFIQYRYKPYRDLLQNKNSNLLKLQILLIYFAVYIVLNKGLQFPDNDDVKFNYDLYKLLDILLIVLSIVVLCLGFENLYLHFCKSAKSLASVVPKENLSMKGELYCRYFRGSSIIDVAADTPLCDLLRVQGVLFFRLSPVGTYDCLKKHCVDISNYLNAMYVVHAIPTTLLYSTTIQKIDGDITIYTLSRSSDESRIKIFLKGGLPSFIINSKIALDSDVYDREVSLQLYKPSSMDNDESSASDKQAVVPFESEHDEPKPEPPQESASFSEIASGLNVSYNGPDLDMKLNLESEQHNAEQRRINFCNSIGEYYDINDFDNFSMTSSMFDEEYERIIQQDPSYYKRETTPPFSSVAAAGAVNSDVRKDSDAALFLLSSSSDSENDVPVPVVINRRFIQLDNRVYDDTALYDLSCSDDEAEESFDMKAKNTKNTVIVAAKRSVVQPLTIIATAAAAATATAKVKADDSISDGIGDSSDGIDSDAY